MSLQDRHLVLEELGWRREVLQQARVLVVGAGAIGNEVLKNLALLGVGTIVVVDLDVIENRNLSRSVLFRPGDVGRMKAEIAAERVREFDTELTVLPLVGRLQHLLGGAFYRRFDLVFGCLDNLQARRDVNRQCLRCGVCYIDGGLRQLDGEVRIFAPPFEVCFDCILDEEARSRAWRRYSCLKLISDSAPGESVPTSPTMAAVVGGWMVQLGAKYLHGLSIPRGEVLSYLGGIDDPGRSRYSPNPACPTHVTCEPITGVRVIELNVRSGRITPAELLAKGADLLGGPCVLHLDQPLLHGLFCAGCATTEPIFRPTGSLTLAEARCPRCSELQRHEVIRAPQEAHLLRGDEPFLHHSLTDLGLPPGGLYELEGPQRTRVYLAVNGDLPESLRREKTIGLSEEHPGRH